MKKNRIYLTLVLLTFVSIFGLTSYVNGVDVVRVEKSIYTVTYSQKYEQPLSLTYRSTNRPTNVNRGSMDFHGESNIHTSDKNDYVRNVWDKGHLAPAATFSDNMDNLYTTFSYLNCALQNQYLNRGEWRLLEEQERKWDDNEPLTVVIDVLFDSQSQSLPTGATVPSGFVKHIKFERSGKWQCYKFTNDRPELGWENHKITCTKH